GKWRTEDALLLEMEGISADALSRALDLCTAWLNGSGTDVRQTARVLLQRSLLAQAAKKPLPSDDSVLERTLKQIGGADGSHGEPDSFVAAASLLAISRGNSHEP